eukprot:scaffold149435_cov31-Tisochrysis_lutea.AAC.4
MASLGTHGWRASEGSGRARVVSLRHEHIVVLRPYELRQHLLLLSFFRVRAELEHPACRSRLVWPAALAAGRRRLHDGASDTE